MRVVGHEKWETLGLGYCKVWCFGGLCSGFLAFEYICIYINDFPKIINELSNSTLFAEDTSIVVTSTNSIEINRKFKSHLHLIFKWFQTSYFVLNANEMCIVKFTFSKAPIYPFTITLVDQILAIAETIVFFGLHLDSHLSWMSHVNILLKKFSSTCFMMRSSSYILNIDMLRIV
jgi:hypothetical protein